MADSTTPAGTNAHLYAFTVTNGASSMWEDGTNIALNSGASADVGRLRLNGLGAAGPSENSDGDVAEVLIYNTVLSRDDERRVGSYLAAKYGLPTAYTYPACIVNGAASGVTATSVVLNATLAGADAVYDVRAYWGAANGGTNVGAWALSALVGSYTNVASTNLTHLAAGLASNAAFFYTFRATNLVEDVWASPSVAFLTAGVHVEATDAVAWEQIANPGAFTVFRPPALTNGDLTVNYTLGGTATNGRDYAALSGSVVIPAGADRATIPVVPIDNERDRGRSDGGSHAGAGRIPDRRARQRHGQDRRAGRVQPVGAQGIGDLYQRQRDRAADQLPRAGETGAGVIPGFDYGQFASSNGYDLRFVDAARSRYLAYEIDRWDTNGESFVWVHMPLLTGSRDTLWAYWGLPAATNPAPFAGNGAAWDPDFRGVWHLNADLRDSTVERQPGRRQRHNGLDRCGRPGACL